MTNNTSAEHRYAARLESIKSSLERLSQARSQNFGVSPEDAGWGDVTLAHDIDEKLKEICNMVFREGEYAS